MSYVAGERCAQLDSLDKVCYVTLTTANNSRAQSADIKSTVHADSLTLHHACQHNQNLTLSIRDVDIVFNRYWLQRSQFFRLSFSVV